MYLVFSVLVSICIITVDGAKFCSEKNESRRPFYLIQRSPKMEEIKDASKIHINGISLEVNFNGNGEPETIGERSVNGLRENFDSYLDYLKYNLDQRQSTYSNNLTVLMYHLNLDDVRSDLEVDAVRVAIEKLLPIARVVPKKFGFVVMISDLRYLSSIQPISTDANIKAIFNGRLAFGFVNGKPSETIANFDQKLKTFTPIWQKFEYEQIGLLPVWEFPHKELAEALTAKTEGKLARVVVQANQATESFDRHIESLLGAGADGLVSIYPANAARLMEGPGFRDKLCLATMENNPFPIEG